MQPNMRIFAVVNEQRLKAAVETFTAFLSARRLRRTRERYAILEAVNAIQGHFAVETLLTRMNEGPLPVSRGTVYNTMSLLLDCGLVRRHQFAGQPPQYESMIGVKANHLHLVCLQCGHVREVTDAEMERLVRNRRYKTFTPDYFALNIYGICSRCARNNRKKATQQQ